jgi:plasmid stability protein
MQYTIRQVPKAVDKALRAKAKAEGKSMNQVAVEALKCGLGICDDDEPKRDLSFMKGTLTPEDAKAMDEARQLFEKIDEDAWR